MNIQSLRKLVIVFLGGAAVTACAPIKTGFSATNIGTPINAVAQFDNATGICSDAKAQASIVADAEGNAFLTRSGCQNLRQPERLNPEELQSSPSGEEVVFRNDLFELNQEENRSNAEAPKSNAEVPRTGSEEPRPNVEQPRPNIEVPRVNTEIPKSTSEVTQPSEAPALLPEHRI